MKEGLIMKRLLLVVDVQNDFVSGVLGTPEARAIVEGVTNKIKAYKDNDHEVVFTKDSHFESDYLETQEGRNLPILHCIVGTYGHDLIPEIEAFSKDSKVINKSQFGSIEVVDAIKQLAPDEIEMIGLCTDICVVSNALIIKAMLPETKITVDASLCAGTSIERHLASLETMKSCQIHVL